MSRVLLLNSDCPLIAGAMLGQAEEAAGAEILHRGWGNSALCYGCRVWQDVASRDAEKLKSWHIERLDRINADITAKSAQWF